MDWNQHDWAGILEEQSSNISTPPTPISDTMG